MAKTIDDMKAELEAEGWESKEYTTATGWQPPIIHVDLWGKSREKAQNEAVMQAYAHLQERRELAVLRKYVLELDKASQEVKRLDGKTTNPVDVATGELFLVANRAFAYIDKFNITADESESDET